MTTRDTNWPDGTPCWIDLLTTDAEAARAFYTGLFGWEFEVTGPEMGNYSVASLGGRNVAGLMPLNIEGHRPVWSTYLATSDAQASVDSAVRAGGTIVQPVMDVGDLGRMAVLQDPASGTFGVWEGKAHTGTQLVNEPGALVWNELSTRGYADAKDFYAAVFGYSFTEVGDGSEFVYSTIEVDGQTVGGIGAMQDDAPPEVPSHWLVYFDVTDVDATLARAQELGGSVLNPARDTPYGRMAQLTDPQGGAFAVITPAAPPAE